MDRRDFFKKTVSAGMAFSFAGCASQTAPHSKVRGANERIRIGIVGLRSKGKHHIELFHKIPNVQIAALCDVDTEFLDEQKSQFDEWGEKVKLYKDIRNLLEDKSIDAISVVTPNHWHSLMGIWACQAGKDVYVEKPVSHNLWEGRKLVEAARKYNRIVQAGTQNRTDEAVQQVFQYINEGHIGAIKVARGFCYKRRKSIGKVAGPQPIPANIDFDLWTGPAPLKPLRRSRVHYDWHWQWDTGNGDIGNQGIHEMDMCRWAIGQDKLPQRVMSFGGRFGYDDDGETPNTLVTILDYKPVPIIFEVRGLPKQSDIEAMDNYHGVRIGVVIECEDGFFAGGHGGGWIYDKNGKKVKQFSSPGGGEHQANFIQAVRSRKRSDLNADILEGHLSSALCHMGNIPYNLGKLVDKDELTDTIKSNPIASEAFERFEDHLNKNNVDLLTDRPTLGTWLDFDPQTEKFVTKNKFDFGYWANKLVRGHYREPFVVPESV